MDNFAERMLERTQRRQELLASASKETAKPVLSKIVEMTKPTESVEPLVSPKKSPLKTPPLQHQRRTRLAELASRVDQWLEEDKVLKPIDKSSTDKKDVSINHTSKQVNAQQMSASSVAPITSILKKTKTVENESSVIKSQPKSQTKGCRLQQLRQKQKSPEKSSPPQWESPNLAAATLTVAQRRALFEQNIATQKTNNKPRASTIFTIPKAETTSIVFTAASTVSEEENNEPVSEMVVTTPPRPIPKSLTSPPSRRGTRPRMSPAIAAATNGTLSPQQRRVWTPPCIKNVLLKKQLNKELENEQQKVLTNDISGTVVTTSSPLDNPIVSPADRIAMSVGHVRFKSPSPSGSLYPDLSLIEDNNDTSDKETISTPIENQITGYKRRNNYVLNSSTASSESVPEDNESNEIFAKRSKCEPSDNDGFCNLPTTQETSTMETSLASSATVTSPVLHDCSNSSVLSGITNNSPISLKSTSFTYYPSIDIPSKIFNNNLAKKYQSPPCSDQQKVNTPCKQINEPQLIHSVSIYRQQQQQLRSSGTPTSKQSSRPGQGDTRSVLLQHRMMPLEDDEQNDDDEDDEDYALQELEMAAARAWHLERTVVPEQDRIIDQATQALNICDVYRQRSGLRSEFSSKFSPEHVHAERLLLIAGLRRTDAVLEAQRLRVERTLLPDGVLGKRDRHPKPVGAGKTLVIESLRVPILSSVISSGSNKNKFSAIEGMENQTRWPGGYRYFVCVVRAVATAHRAPMTIATRPADALEESVRRFSIDAHCNDNGINYGYVEFITKKHVKNSGTKKCALPSASEGAPIMINGLNEDGWKVTIELYGLSPTATGDLENQNSGKDHHDTHENKSVLDKLWSTVKTPHKDSKKHHGILSTTCIESPSGPSTVRNTVFRQLGYFVFSDGQVDRQQFTLNKVHQSGGISNSTNRGTGDETVRVRMRLLEEGEQYVFVDDKSPSGCTKKLLTLPPECKRMEGFLTLFDDHELRATPVIDSKQQWHRRLDIGGGTSGGTTLWRRLWFRLETVDDPQQQKTSDSSDETLLQQQNKTVRRLRTIMLRYWMYPEHAEQQRKPLGSIDLGHCISPKPIEQMTNASSEQNLAPAAPAPSDLCARPNTLRLLLYNSSVNYDDDHCAIKNGVDDPLLLSADTADERREWCDTVNVAVNAIGEHRKWFKLVEQQKKENEEQKHQQQNQHHTGAWPTTSFGSGKSLGKKKKLCK